MNEPKSAFDFSGPSIWTRDTQLIFINNGKINGLKRREQMKRTDEPKMSNKRTKKKGETK